jgi:hypothetical protein
LTLAGRVIVPAPVTVTLEVALDTVDERAAPVMVVVPEVTPETDTVAVVAPAAMVTAAGIVTIPVGVALRLTSSPPAGAGADKVSVRLLL